MNPNMSSIAYDRACAILRMHGFDPTRPENYSRVRLLSAISDEIQMSRVVGCLDADAEISELPACFVPHNGLTYTLSITRKRNKWHVTYSRVSAAGCDDVLTCVVDGLLSRAAIQMMRILRDMKHRKRKAR